MKIILASQGFTTQEIAEATAKLAGKTLNNLNVAIINEAYVTIDTGRDERWMINELMQLANYAKGTIAFVNLRAYNTQELIQRFEFADVIYIVGGKQLILPRLFRETGFDTILKESAKTKVIFGTSAGANVLGKQIVDTDYWQDQYGSSSEFLSEPSMGLVDFNILPHFERSDHPRRTRDILTPLLKDHPFPLYGVTDTQAVVSDNGQTSFLGGEPVIFGNQH
ncbi:MAG: dipeptidase [Patescibacteria group bacterium]|nr:dipeptidase [Patescibacteria group bacterium]